jgi:hypothetical protein
VRDVVAAREFGKRTPSARRRRASAFCASVNFEGSAHVLAALLRPAAALGGAGADMLQIRAVR